MIQDIAPHRFDNAYRRVIAQADSAVLLFRRGSIYLARDKEEPYPSARQLPAVDRAALQYLFTLDERAYFTLWKEPARLPEGYAFEPIRLLRAFAPRELAFAGISGYQLWQWYASRLYCGGCGRLLRHAEDERMLYCEACSIMEYPKIAPAVIVAVLHGEFILLTRYANHAYQKDALIAGFCEIGESLEDTVRREVWEEVGLRVKNIRYYKSQPWSFTDTLLAGFFCEVDGGSTIVREEKELAQARWVKRELVPKDEEGISLTGEMMQVFREGREQSFSGISLSPFAGM